VEHPQHGAAGITGGDVSGLLQHTMNLVTAQKFSVLLSCNVYSLGMPAALV
jgi:hypothetical protein